MTDHPSFRTACIRPDMLGATDTDWRAYIEVAAEAVQNLDDVISLGDRYLLSLGAHQDTAYYLLDRSGPEPLSVEMCLKACALMSYAVDAPVVAVLGGAKLGATDASTSSRALRGTVFSSISEYGEFLRELAASTERFVSSGLPRHSRAMRILLRNPPGSNQWYFYPWPPTERVFRGIGAYAMGALSGLAPSRILNFWRATEAVTTKAERGELFETLPTSELAPVWTSVRRIPFTNGGERVVNATRALRRVALQRRDALIAVHSTADQALDYLYQESRGKAAHADKYSLEHDLASDVSNQFRDAELLRYLARAAIERAWRAAA